MNPLPPETAEPRRPRKPNVALWAVVAVIGCFAVGIGAVGAYIYPLFVRFRATRANGICIRRLQQSSRAMSMYAADNDDTLPAASGWMLATRSLVRSERAFHCPEAWREKPGAYGYAMNVSLSSRKKSKISNPGAAPLVFDSTLLGRNAAGDLSTLPKRGRHRGANNVAFADGHVGRMRAAGGP